VTTKIILLAATLFLRRTLERASLGVYLLDPKHRILIPTPFARRSLALGVELLFVPFVVWLCTLGVSVVVTETIIAIVVVVFRSLAHRCISVELFSVSFYERLSRHA
jgi:hypothetical protein